MIKKCELGALVALGVCCGVAQASDGHQITVFSELQTVNSSLVDASPIKLGEKLGMSQAITNNLYYTVSATVPRNSNYTLETDVGLTKSFHRFSPFIELEGMMIHDKLNHNTWQLDYDFGTSYQLTPTISPLVLIDGLGVRGEDALEYGASFKLNKRFSLTVEGVKMLREAGSGAEVKLSFIV